MCTESATQLADDNYSVKQFNSVMSVGTYFDSMM